MRGPSVFPSGDPGVSGDFWGSQEGSQAPGKLQNGVVIIPYKIMVPMTYFGKSLQTINQIKPLVGLVSWLEEW